MKCLKPSGQLGECHQLPLRDYDETIKTLADGDLVSYPAYEF